MPIVQIFDKDLAPSRIQALKFGLWIGMASIVMLFGALTSAYLVRKPAGNWYEFKLPMQFFYSTLIIIVSSVFLEMAYRKFKNGLDNYRIYLTLSVITGVAFILSQIFAFKEMFNSGLTIDLNVSVSFIYVLAGFHALHVFGGIVALIITILVALTTVTALTDFKILKFNLLRQYWHFVGVLWIYLLLFLILQ